MKVPHSRFLRLLCSFFDTDIVPPDLIGGGVGGAVYAGLLGARFFQNALNTGTRILRPVYICQSEDWRVFPKCCLKQPLTDAFSCILVVEHGADLSIPCCSTCGSDLSMKKKKRRWFGKQLFHEKRIESSLAPYVLDWWLLNK